MNNSEKNMLFLSALILLTLVAAGINGVDRSLNNMLEPEVPLSTFKINYEHGFKLLGQESERHFRGQEIVSLSVKDIRIDCHNQWLHIEIPFIFQVTDIEKLRSVTEMLTK